MRKIKYIRDGGDGAPVRLTLDEGEDAYTLSHTAVSRLGLFVGMDVDEYLLSEIECESEKYRAMRRALSILSYGDNTRKTLAAKLIRAGFSREVADECVSECLRLGYIDEARQIERAALTEANRALRGKGYIVKKLTARGYPVSLIGDVIDSLVARGEIDFSENFRRLAEKRGIETEEEKRILAYKYGFGSFDFGD